MILIAVVLIFLLNTLAVRSPGRTQSLMLILASLCLLIGGITTPMIDLEAIIVDNVDEAIDGCIDLFRQAIKRRIKTPSVNHMLLLSGGQDSRHIAAERRL